VEKQIKDKWGEVYTKKEKRLHEEIQRLKAQLFEQNLISQLRLGMALRMAASREFGIGLQEGIKESDDINSFDIFTLKKNISKIGLTKHKNSSNKDTSEKNITISKKEYDRLVSEIKIQETLIQGFQQENKRLFELIKSREREEDSKKAKFYDQRNELNIELNRLRNEAHTVIDVSKDAQELRKELDQEALIRELREKVALAESAAGIREKELQIAIEKLRSENRELIETISQTRNQNNSTYAIERKGFEDDNQEIIDMIQQERLRLQSSVNILKRELIKSGYKRDNIMRLLSDDKVKDNRELDNESEDRDQSLRSISRLDMTPGKSPITRRNPSDIKKIR
jgi:hypothetical protein